MRTYHLMTAVAGLAAFVAAGIGSAAAQTRTTLDIYVIDVEGGNATLFVSPSQSLLIDTGNVRRRGRVRDAGRIMEAVKDAGLTQIDHLITTHWHGDHFGGLAELAKRIPIREFIDHGPNVQPGPRPTISSRTPTRSSTPTPSTPSRSRAIRSRSPVST